MNTTRKGDEFESRCFDIIKAAIEKGELGIIKENAYIHRKKGYLSAKRGGDIIFDLTIEVWPKNSKNPSIIYFI